MKPTKKQERMIFEASYALERWLDEEREKYKKRTGKDLFPPLPKNFLESFTTNKLGAEENNEPINIDPIILDQISKQVDEDIEKIHESYVNHLIEADLNSKIKFPGISRNPFLLGNLIKEYGFEVSPKYKKYLIDGQWRGSKRDFHSLLFDNKNNLKGVDIKFLINIHVANGVEYNRTYMYELEEKLS